jgi:membrane associated rhomboid family serine protease
MKLMPFELSSQLINQYGMVSLRYSNPQWAINTGLPFDYYLSFVTNLFLHADWVHLMVNLWFLWIFADNVEDRMGRLPFLVFYLLCGAFASALQWYSNPNIDIPLVGASSAVAGILAAYFFLYPLERVVLWLPPFFLIHVPAIMFLGVWVIIQLDNITTSIGTEHVAWWAHLGGFIAGSLLYRFFVKKPSVE